jgi:hypothetical protein
MRLDLTKNHVMFAVRGVGEKGVKNAAAFPKAPFYGRFYDAGLSSRQVCLF